MAENVPGDRRTAGPAVERFPETGAERPARTVSEWGGAMTAIRAMGGLLVLLTAPAWAEDKKEPPEKRSGTVVGVVTAKEKNSIDVKADGEEKARRYYPRWIGGLPKDGGGLDKKTLETYAKLELGTRIKLMW